MVVGHLRSQKLPLGKPIQTLAQGIGKAITTINRDILSHFHHSSTLSIKMGIIIWLMTVIHSILVRLGFNKEGSLLPTCKRQYAPETSQLLVNDEEFSWDYAYGSLDGFAQNSKPSSKVEYLIVVFIG